MNKADILKAQASLAAAMSAQHGIGEARQIKGVYRYKLFEFDGGPLISEGEDENVVTYVGQNQLLAAALQGSSYSVTGPYMGLISSSSYSAVAIGDTMSSHAGWLEANATNAPPYGSTRPTLSLANAPALGVISSSAASSFTFTGSGTVEGAFITFGSGALSSNTSTAGVLLSASAFGAAQPVINGNVLAVSYSLTL